MNAGRFAWMTLVALLGCSKTVEASGTGAAGITVAKGDATMADAAAPAGVPQVDVGRGIGPVRLGMTRAEIDALGLPVKDDVWALHVGPYRARLEQGRVVLVEVALADLPGGLWVAGEVVAPTEKDIARIAAHLPGCGRMEMREGGNLITCSGGSTHVKAGGPVGIVAIDVVAAPRFPDAGPPCSGGRAPCAPPAHS
jgi:hypothetical protein